ncbi:MAG: FAD-dependent oxidoreductase [Vulcanimicrobiaceae bacterium]|jgi:thioredoxin reductase (NADPH)
MFTRDELRTIPLFSSLADKELDHLASTSADIRLQAGEYAIREGEPRRAFYIVVEGGIEGTKFVDGVERVIGARGPGETFGEVPVILDTPSLANFRATTPARVMRIELKDFRALATAAPEIAASITTIAMERVEGLQELAAAPAHILAVIAPEYHAAGHDLREFLRRNSIEYDWTIPEDSVTTPTQRFPIVRLPDGTLLGEPSIRDLAVAIGLCVFPRTKTYDVAIVGGGPAGLAAAVYGASEGLSTIMIEQEAPGGQAGTSSRIENYLGFPFGISGDDLANRALQQATRLGAEIVVTRAVESLDVDERVLSFDGGDYVCAKTIVIATGVAWRRLNVPSLSALQGRGVFFGAAPGEERSIQGKDVYLVGGGNSAGQAAINFSSFARSVTLLVRGDSLASSMSDYLIKQLKTKANVRVETHAEVVDAIGNDHLEAITVVDNMTQKTTQRDASALFILIGADAETAWLPASIQRDVDGYVCTGADAMQGGHWPLERYPFILETSVPGIFAVGDVRAGSIKRVAASVGEGSMAIAFVHRYLGGG